jgi:hypothetical protein
MHNGFVFLYSKNGILSSLLAFLFGITIRRPKSTFFRVSYNASLIRKPQLASSRKIAFNEKKSES